MEPMHLKVIGDRPTQIAASDAEHVHPSVKREGDHIPIGPDWLIFHGGRAMLGHVEWRGEPVANLPTGVFYAAIDPQGVRAEQMIDVNAGLHGFVLDYTPMQTIMAWLAGYAAAHDTDVAELTARCNVIELYWEHHS